MAEYIDKELAKKTLCDDYAYAAVELLDEVPVADVAEVRHGKWIKFKNQRECSECGYFYFSNNVNTNYCCNCGAKMDKERV